MVTSEFPSDFERLLREHHVGLMTVFGSRAAGTGRQDSDLDIGVLHADDRPFTFRELADLAFALEALRAEPATPAILRVGAIDLADLASPDAIFRFEVARTGRVVHADSPDRLVAFLTQTLIDYDELSHFIPALIAGVERVAREESRR